MAEQELLQAITSNVRKPRNIDWAEELFGLITQRANTPFTWGSNDCVSFANEAVKRMTGVDFMSSFPPYTTALEAARLVKKLGGLEAIVDLCLVPTPVLMAQRGDVVLIPMQDGGEPALAIAVGTHAWGPGDTGLIPRPIELATKAWKV